jgi:RNA polymerase sigma factor (sigma-70 family)
MSSEPPPQTGQQAQREAYARGQAAHAGLPLDFGAFLARRVGAAAPKFAEDYYLARACDRGVPGAWEKLQHSFDRRLRAFLRKRGAGESEASQLLDEVWGALAVPPARGGASSTIGTYDGRGPLHAWLATIVWRRLTDSWRARSAEAPLSVAGAGAGSERANPAACLADDETAHLLGEALEDAWSGLTKRELQAVVLKYRHQLPQTEIARALEVGAPRVSRILNAAAARLREAIESRFGEQRDWNAPEGGWTGLFEAVERILSRAAVAVDVPIGRRSDHG